MRKIILFSIFIIGLAVRFYKIDIPLLEFYPSRQIQTADITRNFYKDGIDLLAPRVSYLGPTKELLVAEFPIYNFYVSLLYKITNTSNEILGRAFSVLGWALSYFLLYRIAVKYIGQNASLIAVFFYTFSPVSVLVSRSFQPDQWLITVSLFSIYFADTWTRKKNSGMFYVTAVFASISLLMKITSGFFTFLPIVYLIKQAQGRLLTAKTIVFSIISVSPAIFWYYYASSINKLGTAIEKSSEISNWFGFDVFVNPKYYANIFGFIDNLVLLPFGILLFIVGVSGKIKKDSYFLYAWLGSIILYFLFFNKHNMTHEYYLLPFLPIASIFIGLGAYRIVGNLRSLIIPKSLLFLVSGCLIFLMMFVVTMQRAYKSIDRFGHVTDAASAIKRHSAPDDLIIGAMDAGPSLVYYADRPGWSFEINREDVAGLYAFYGVENQKVISAEEELELLRTEGAKIFAAGNLQQFENNKSFSQYMSSRYNVLEKTDDYIVFDLEEMK